MNTTKTTYSKSALAPAQDNTRNTALHDAASGGHEKIVRFLVKEKADVNAKSDKGMTALDYAAKNEKHAIVRLFAS